MTRVASHFQDYRELSKSGIVFLVLISVTAGYLLGQSLEAQLNFAHFLLTLAGVFFLASGSSAFNQIQERDLDAKMPRTAKRPLPSGRMSLREATVFSAVCVTLGLILLSQINPGILILGVLALVTYNGFYTLWWKRNWSFGAVPGAIPGALPILMGYVGATGTLIDPAGIYLFAILFFWQMPHFWVLALQYQKDYAQGSVPTLPVAHGPDLTRQQILVWCLGYLGLAIVGPVFIELSWIYWLPAFAVSVKVLLELRNYLKGGKWIRFFLWINFSLIIYLFAMVIDRWSVFLQVPIIQSARLSELLQLF